MAWTKPPGKRFLPEEKEMLERAGEETGGIESHQISHNMAQEILCFKLVLAWSWILGTTPQCWRALSPLIQPW